VARDTVSALARESGLVAATGPAGTALVFGDLLMHASPGNLSPYDRRIFSLILNPVGNTQTSFARPDHKHHRDLTPVQALADDCLLEPAPVAAG
jgi:ectoine hydroxylase